MKKLVALLATILATSFTLKAATPAAVWDGDFSATQTGFTLNRSGNAISQDNSTITIDQSVGVKVDFTTGFASAMTVMFKYSDLAFDAQKTLATSFCSGGDENRTGVYALRQVVMLRSTVAQLVANAPRAARRCFLPRRA